MAKTKTSFVENQFGRKIRLQKDWAVVMSKRYGYRIRREDLKVILLKNGARSWPYPLIQLYRMVGGVLSGAGIYTTVSVIRSSYKLNIGCQVFTRKNKKQFIEWATAKAV
jgi:hypothetical protein